MSVFKDESQGDCQIDYEKSIFDYYDSGTVTARKIFNFDVENQQWLEGEKPKLDVEKKIKKMSHEGDRRLFLPCQWAVELRTTGVVAVSLQLYMAEIRQGTVESIQEKIWQIECDFPNRSVKAWPMGLLRERRGGWVGMFSCSAEVTFPDMLGAYYVEIPTVVTEVALSFMQEVAEKEFGFHPTYMGRIHGLEHMVAYCVRPLDLNIYLLRQVIGERFELLFPGEQRDNYRPLCRFFQIDHPPKSLRKAYGEGAENFVAYLLLRQLGFRDINVIRRFFYRDKLFGYRLLNLKYSTRYSKLTFAVDNNKALYLLWLERFCHWFLRYRKETQLANCLQPLAVQDAWEQENIDILRMFAVANLNQIDNELHTDTKRIILREGFTRNVHDLIMNDLRDIMEAENRARLLRAKTIQYTEKESQYVGEIEGYSIILPKDTDEIKEYGRAFHNCVASYKSAVLEKRTLILAMKQGDKYIACLEVKQSRLVQALGPCNQSLSSEIENVLCKWAENKKIIYIK